MLGKIIQIVPATVPTWAMWKDTEGPTIIEYQRIGLWAIVQTDDGINTVQGMTVDGEFPSTVEDVSNFGGYTTEEPDNL